MNGVLERRGNTLSILAVMNTAWAIAQVVASDMDLLCIPLGPTVYETSHTRACVTIEKPINPFTGIGHSLYCGPSARESGNVPSESATTLLPEATM